MLFRSDIITASGGNNIVYGGGGDDIITVAGGNNIVYGSNDILLGYGERDTLVGGGVGSTNNFVLGTEIGSYYVGNGSDDFVTVSGFRGGSDVIQLAGFDTDYVTSFAGGVTSVFYVSPTGLDLIAKINSTSLLDLNGGSFVYINTNRGD